MKTTTAAHKGTDGKYDAASDKICVCGHSRGVHSEHGIACFAGDEEGVEICECEKFKRAK